MVANDAGDRVTPAVVAYRDDEQVYWRTLVEQLLVFVVHLCTVLFDILFDIFFFLIFQIVGIAAKQGRTWNSANTVLKVKQLLGRR